MSARSVHKAAVEAGAAGLCVRDGEGCPAHHLCEAEAERVIAALVASAEVRKGLEAAIGTTLHGPDWDGLEDAYTAEDGASRFLAALAGEAT